MKPLVTLMVVALMAAASIAHAQYQPQSMPPSGTADSFFRGLEAGRRSRADEQRWQIEQERLRIERERLDLEKQKVAAARQQAEQTAPAPQAHPAVPLAAGSWRHVGYASENGQPVRYMFDAKSVRVLGEYRLLRWTVTATPLPLVTDPAYIAHLNCTSGAAEMMWPSSGPGRISTDHPMFVATCKPAPVSTK